jgi:hypothetical protein
MKDGFACGKLAGLENGVGCDELLLSGVILMR